MTPLEAELAAEQCRSSRTATSVAGSVASPVSAGTATWADIASLAPAAIAARNGTSSFGLERSRGRRGPPPSP